MKSLSEYTPEEQETIIDNFMLNEYGNDEYDSEDAILHFKEEVDALLDEFEYMSGDNELEIVVKDFVQHMWEINGELGLIASDPADSNHVEAAVTPTAITGDMEVVYDLYISPEDMPDSQRDELEDKYDWPLISLTDTINELADEYGWKAAYGCDINDKESVRDYLQKNEMNVNLEDYLGDYL